MNRCFIVNLHCCWSSSVSLVPSHYLYIFYVLKSLLLLYCVSVHIYNVEPFVLSISWEGSIFICLSCYLSLSLFFDSLALFCHPLPFLMPSPSPAGASSLLHSTNESGNYARWQCEHNVCGSGVAHALRQVDAQLRGLDTGGWDACGQERSRTEQRPWVSQLHLRGHEQPWHHWSCGTDHCQM